MTLWHSSNTNVGSLGLGEKKKRKEFVPFSIGFCAKFAFAIGEDRNERMKVEI